MKRKFKTKMLMKRFPERESNIYDRELVVIVWRRREAGDKGKKTSKQEPRKESGGSKEEKGKWGGDRRERREAEGLVGM